MWKEEGIIDEYQAGNILSRYGLAEITPEPGIVVKEDRASRLIVIVLVLGALLIGIGVILLVASNWRNIPDSAKFLLLFITTFAMYFGGWKSKYGTKSHPKLGQTLLFLASIFVGVTIFLTAQIFHVNANNHWIVLLWFIAIMPLGYAFNSKEILGLNIFTLTLWMVLYTSSSGSIYMKSFETFMLYLLFGITLYSLGYWHSVIKKYSHFRLVFQGVGLFFILASYYYFSLETPYRRFFGEVTVTDRTVQLLFVLFGITSLISIAHSVAKRDIFKPVKYEFFVLLLAFAGWIGILLVILFKESVMSTTTTLEPGVATTLFIVVNLIYFALSVGSILIGYYKFIVSFVNIGMLFFIVGIVHLYFTTLYELLPRSIAFIAGGLILLGVGWYLEKKRRSLIKNIEIHSRG